MVKSVTVRAPCSTANLGPGFDVFGMALDAFYDEVTVTKKPKSFGIKIVSSDDIPLDPKKNTAGLVAESMMKEISVSDGVEISIKKNVPAGYGLGSSAASAAACAIGIAELFEYVEHFYSELILYHAGYGEKASAGTAHYDNVAASLFGGFVVVNPYLKRETKFSGLISFSSLQVPNSLRVVVAIPKISVPKQKTKASRSVLPKNVKFSDAVQNLAFATQMIAELGQGKNANGVRFGHNILDAIVEPARKKMIPGFDEVKNNALNAGANACTISGAGPSVIAFQDVWNRGDDKTKEIGEAMRNGFKSAKVDCDIVICKPSQDGAKIMKVVE
ncbi:MAG: homoserine kinase [Crenarchaeota archaeon]|nr:homoserine kinase [Thermoproteota archaeon]MDA1124782.1 homoserine kinase [Thermoproteota archaeon]